MSDIIDCKDNLLEDQVDTPSNMTILDMTEDCTRLVFDRLTLNQLIHLRAVCHTWNDIITDICEHKSTLRLFFSGISIRHFLLETSILNIQNHPHFELNKQNLLSLSPITKLPSSNKQDGSFSDQQNDPNLGIRFIARLFPNITNFVCEFQYSRMFELSYILGKWSTTLDTLTIFCEPSHFNRKCIHDNAQQDFVKCFEMMRSLRRLHLLDMNRQLKLPNMAIFGQLEEFSFHSSLCVVNFARFFAQLDANRCTFLRVGYHRDAWDTLPNLTDVNLELASKLTHLAIYFNTADTRPNHISRYIAKFQNLKHLEIINSCYRLMADLLNEIVPLTKLETLTLPLSSFVRLSQYHNNPTYPNSFPIFPNTITELCLIDKHLNSYFPQFKEYQLLAKIFPMLRNIKIYCTHLNKTTFDEQFRPQFSEAFGEQVEVIFYRINLLMFDKCLNIQN